MKVYKNINELLTLSPCLSKDGRNLTPDDLGIIKNAAVVFDDNMIHWVGETSKIPTEYSKLPSSDLSGHVVTPEIVDSHTHLIFGGNRANEYQMRLNGADYQAIANAGGGIIATSTGTNNSSEEDLLNLCRERIERIYSYGVGTIEIKSGYSLTYEGEKRLTLIIDKLKKEFAPKVQIINTFMAAHAIPKSCKDSSEYMRDIVIPSLEELAPLNIIDCVDIFHEEGYFTKQDVILLSEKCKELQLSIKTHADEFNDNKGAILACDINALSTDHLLCMSEDGAKKLAQSNTVATVLPGTGLFLGKPQADAKKITQAGAKLAIASDYNPGSCHCDNLLLIASIAAPLYGINMTQMWCGITYNAACALGLRNQGIISEGMSSRLSVFKVNEISEITYNWGRNFNVSRDLL